MKPSATEKFLAALLFSLTVAHTTAHFSAPTQTETHSPMAPCSAADHPLGKQLQIYGQIAQIELGIDSSADPFNVPPSGRVWIAVNTDVDCQIEAFVADQEWQSWSTAQQDLISIGTLVELGGHIRTAGGQLVLEVDQPPDLH